MVSKGFSFRVRAPKVEDSIECSGGDCPSEPSILKTGAFKSSGIADS